MSGQISPVLRAGVQIEFSPQDKENALGALLSYSEPEPERVRRAILVLANGKIRELHRLVAKAQCDYRDILFCAEWPNMSGGGSKEGMRQRYQALGFPIPEALMKKPMAEKSL